MTERSHKISFIVLIPLILSIGVVPALLSEASAGSLVEFKKYKVTNSDKVCGDKLCSEIDEQRSQKGLSTRDIKICGDIPCYDITNKKIKSFNKSSPLGQHKLGIITDLIECMENKVLIIKSTNQLPACVNTDNVEKLRERNWAVSEQVQLNFFEKLVDDRKNGLITKKILADYDIGLSITHDEIANQRYLVIDGFGWHRLHNVEITITSNDFKESIRSKTTDNGDLSTLWQIPDSINGGVYNIFATDGIHEFELEIPIIINLN